MSAVTNRTRLIQASVMPNDLARFSFRESPVLVVEDFWSSTDRRYVREVMAEAAWKSLEELPTVRADFPHAGNWAKAEIAHAAAERLLERLQLKCIQDYIESFPNIVRRHVGLSFYSYAAGDCLPIHDDTDQGHGVEGRSTLLRRLAVVSYFHEEWRSDWGGELILYARRELATSGVPDLVPTHCIEPRPGSLVIFTVPRFHRVCRVDPSAGRHRRLSMAGWFMTEHA